MLDRLIDLLTAAWHWFIPWVVLSEFEAGVVLRLGRFHRELGPGFHWVLPGAEVCFYDSIVTDTAILASQPLTTRDGVQISIQPLLTYQIRDLKKLLLTVQDREKALHDSAAGVISHLVLNHTWAEVCTPEFLATAHKAVRARGFRYGIAVEELQFPGVQKTRSYMLLQQHKYE